MGEAGCESSDIQIYQPTRQVCPHVQVPLGFCSRCSVGSVQPDLHISSSTATSLFSLQDQDGEYCGDSHCTRLAQEDRVLRHTQTHGGLSMDPFRSSMTSSIAVEV